MNNNSAEKTISSRAGKKQTGELIVVGIGASAGGLEALQKMLPGLPSGVGMAYVVVQHLAPQHHTSLSELLGRHTKMAVTTIDDDQEIKADTIYITPPNKDVRYSGGMLKLQIAEHIGPKPSIDVFLLSLAKEKKTHAVGIILSGTGSDGAHGIRAIKAEEGITIAQTAESADFAGMPNAALETGLIDISLEPEKIGEALLDVQKYPSFIKQVPVKTHIDDIDTILKKVNEGTGFDFSDYKKNTVHRRIGRRMAILKIDAFKDYLSLLETNPKELRTLAKDMLISVTAFFRDAEAYKALETCLRNLLDKKKPGETFRAWVPGCATGEEAYSIAMLIVDILGEKVSQYTIQIFATDIDEDAIQSARRGIYPVATIMETNKEYLNKYFDHHKHSIKVKKPIRDMVILARQDVIKDSSFMRLDLISCRNLLIYMNTKLQDKLLSLFHFSLNRDGLLFLGKSESIGQHSRLFTTVNLKWKIFKARETSSKQLPELMPHRQVLHAAVHFNAGEKNERDDSLQNGRLFNTLLEMLDCCAVLTDRHGNIGYIHGDVAPYFIFPKGNLKEKLTTTALAHRELHYPLQLLLRKAAEDEQETCSKTVIFNEGRQVVRIKVRQLSQGKQDHDYLITFIPAESPGVISRSESAGTETDQKHIAQLERDLKFTDDDLQNTIEKLESSTEELQSLNEDLQSANEKLQVTIEELETSNEELHATNEELNIGNEELSTKTDEAAKLIDNLSESEARYRGLVTNMNEALMLCEIKYSQEKRPTDLIIHEANTALKKLFSFKNNDLPIRTGAMQLLELVSQEILARFENVASGGKPQKFELSLSKLEKDLTLSVYPVDDNRLGIICRDDTERKAAEITALNRSENKHRELIETANSIIIRWEKNGTIRFINNFGLRFFGYTAAELLGNDIMTIIPKVEKSSGRDLEALVKEIAEYPDNHTYRPNENITKNGDLVWVAWSNKAIRNDQGEVVEILAIGNDITALKQAQQELQEGKEHLDRTLAEKEVLLKEIHHRVKNNMQVISSLISLQSNCKSDANIADIFKDLTHRVRSMAMVHEKLYQSHDLANIDFADYIQNLLTYLWKAHGTEAAAIRLQTNLLPISLPVNIAVPCGLIVNELVNNALKHAFSKRHSGRVSITLEEVEEDRVKLVVSDDGTGLPSAINWRKTTSMGLRLIHMLTDQIKADVQVTTSKGTTFIIIFDKTDS